MNNILSLSSVVLEHILLDKIPFSVAKRNYLSDKKLSNFDKNNVAKVVGASLRHYLLLNKKIDEIIPDLELSKKVDVFVYLGNKIYAKVVDKDTSDTFLQTSLTNKIENIDITLIDLLINKSNEENFTHIEKVEGKETEYNSLVYNIPTWIINMWNKHFNETISFKTIRALARKQNKFYLVNEALVDIDEFLNEHPYLVKSEYPDLYLYNGEDNIKSLECYKNYEVMEFNAGLNHALETCDLDPFRKVAIYSGTQSNIYAKLVSKFSKQYKFDVMTDNSECLFSAKNFAKNLGITNNMRIYEISPSSMITCVSEPVHLMIVIPDSSNLAKLGTDPDYFLRFGNQQLDELITKQKLALHEASNLIEDGGELLYAVPTINRKEGKDVIHNFIKEHDNFVIGEEYQFLPFHPYGSSLYFARLRKKNPESENND